MSQISNTTTNNQLDQQIANEMLDDALESLSLKKYEKMGNPKLVLLGGQPASGKSSIIGNLTEKYKKNIVVLNSDDYKEYYPDYSISIRENPDLITQVHPYSNYVLGEVLKQTAPRRINALLEGTMRSSEYPLQVVDGFKSCGYSVDVYFVSCNKFSSTVGHIERFETEIARRLFGRAVPQSHHDDAYNNIPTTIEKLLDSGKIDVIKIVDRNGDLIADSTRGDDVVKAYISHREAITPELFKSISARIDKTILMKQNRNASLDEIDYLFGIKKDLIKEFERQFK